MKRGSGVLLHILSLPGRYGIGDFGPAAYAFVDFLKAARQGYWQLLPLNPTDAVYGESPYSSVSAFALNTLLISPERLVDDGLLTRVDLGEPVFPDGRVDYAAVRTYKTALLQAAFARFQDAGILAEEFSHFCEENRFWLEGYAQFLILKQQLDGRMWNQWPRELKERQPTALAEFLSGHQARLRELKFYQFLAHRQWQALRQYCRTQKIQLIGDIPIYVNYDSADVWSSPQFFKLTEDGSADFVAGVPPDYFSKTGQRWGNPVYAWERLRADHFGWWTRRMAYNLRLFDVARIDHFRGLVDFWQIPAAEVTAINGEWVKVPTQEFFDHLLTTFPDMPIIAEDLGIITDEVREVMAHYGFPGMKIVLFAFGEDIKTHPYIPDNYDENCVAYTGTHDNNTIQGWFRHDATEKERQNLQLYLGTVKPRQLHWQLIEAVTRSAARIAMIPIQDFLGLGAEARMNVPATTDGNWQWRLSPSVLTPALTDQIARLAVSSQRV